MSTLSPLPILMACVLMLGLSGAWAELSIGYGDPFCRLDGGRYPLGWTPGPKNTGTNLSAEDNSSASLLANQSTDTGALPAGCATFNTSLAPGSLEFDSSASVIGMAHQGWASWDPRANEKGRHVEYGRRTTDLVGVFSIEMIIKLASNETCSKSADWLPSI